MKKKARQAWEPAGFIPKKKCKHRLKQMKLVQEESTQKKFTTKPVTTKNQGNAKHQKKQIKKWKKKIMLRQVLRQETTYPSMQHK